MALRSDAVKDELVDKVVATVQSKMSGKKAALAEVFVRHFYANMSVDDIETKNPEDLYGAALSLWNFGSNRESGAPKLRVYNPRADQFGWHSPHTVIEIVHDDMPFLVDSITAELNRHGFAVHLVIHPVFSVERNAKGQMQELHHGLDRPKKAVSESFMHVEIDEQPSAEALRKVESNLSKVLVDVRQAVDDWPKMREQLISAIKDIESAPPALPEEEIKEGLEFLKWVHDDHFTFLGYRELAFSGTGKSAKMDVVRNSGLGLLRDPNYRLFEGLRNLGSQTPEVRAFVQAPKLLMLSKSSRPSTVHRNVHMDTIGIKKFGKDGKIIGELLFTGLFTSVAYSETPRKIPLLRHKVAQVMDMSGFRINSHNGKALMHVLEDYPRDELFQTDVDDLHDIARGIVYLQERHRVALFLRHDPYERYISAIVYLPRDRMNTNLRVAFENILSNAFNGSVKATYTNFTDDALGRLLFIVKTKPGAIPDYDRKEIESRLVEAGRTWADHLKQALVEHFGEAQGNALFARYGDAFPVAYREQYSAQTAVFDAARVEKALDSGDLDMNLYRPIEADEHELSFKTYSAHENLTLSDILPMLENMGLKVIKESPFIVSPHGTDKPFYIHDFGMRTADGGPVDLAKVRDAFHESFARTWRGDIEDDGFNRLVLQAHLSWREVVILRAYSKYLRQARTPFSQSYMEQTLAAYPDLCRLLIRLFGLRLDPDFDGDRANLEPMLQAALDQELDAVTNLDEDRIIRHFLNLIQCTLRTSYYQDDSKPYVAFKFDSGNIDELPLPRPMREIWVYSPRFEAVHLRFGLVARGGLRWSDRREDFRTEILGLVKAQQVKNTVIVPVGSKGGFVLKNPPPPSDRKAFHEEGVACYKLFMSAMLDITDNLVAGAVAPPPRVVRQDGDDPYLVVAADKGTATFSDIANEVAISYGFWLGDAFASGGSVGYDHKKMGITARGGWESVKRHFRELGVDTQSQDFTVVGCGDMSGDVFGNGMLLSPHIKLVGAFNHMHIFVDPNPDPAAGIAERRRLFDQPGSVWTDYDKKLISKGGAIFDRTAKSLKLSPEIRELFGIDAAACTPSELIKAMLRAEVDLLWFGGIGTYVRASNESDAEVGDRANDALRVRGADLRCKVVGEGANLGATQRGRIEYARRGGRINTDFIDNSAGVDCSDHEVNIKILCGDYVERGDMTEKQRNKLLEEMTDEVGELCLRDNYAQTQAISVTESRALAELDSHQRLMRFLERAGTLDRSVELLPDDEQIDNLRSSNLGLTRPEIAVIFSYAKNATYAELLASDLPDDPLLVQEVVRYFPRPMRKTYRDGIERHRLRREIIATAITNGIVNRTGPSFVNEMRDRTGYDAPAIARAFTVARDAFSLRPLWVAIEALDNKVPAELQIRMMRETSRTIDRMTVWFLRHAPHPLDISSLLDTFKPGVETLLQNLQTILQPDQLADIDDRTQRFVHDNTPSDVAAKIGSLKVLSSACDVVRLAENNGQPVLDAGQTYFAIGSRFKLDWLRRGANRLPVDNAWHQLAVDAIIDDLWNTQDDLSNRVLQAGGAANEALDKWLTDRRERVARVDQLLGELEIAGHLDLAMLAVANRELRSLVT